jgi:hypothetical protein
MGITRFAIFDDDVHFFHRYHLSSTLYSVEIDWRLVDRMQITFSSLRLTILLEATGSGKKKKKYKNM